MHNDPLAPSAGPPPRQVRPWTHVPGHEVVTSSRRHAICTCGEQQRDSEQPADQWRDVHLREAWPVLVPRDESESLVTWMARVSEQYVAASKAELELAEELGLGMPLREGQHIPVMTPEYSAAGDRVVVIKHQMDVLRKRILGGANESP